MPIAVRLALPSDAPALCEVNVRSIREVCACDYTPAQVADWCANKTPEKFLQWIGEPHLVTYAGLLDERIAGVGMLDLDQGWIYLLYLVPEALGAGLGKALLSAMEARAQAYGHGKLSLTATVTAHGFYSRQGYRTLAPIESSGKPAFRMEKRLVQGSASPLP